MATDRTPLRKRIERAEKSAIEWKIKAIERREENERLDLTIKDMRAKIEKFDELINNLSQQVESLKSNLEKECQIAGKLQSENEALKKKQFLKGSKPYKHRFPSKIIKMAIDLFRCGLGYNQISNVFKALEPHTNMKSPHYSTVRQWMMRNSYSKLHLELPDSTWIVLGDVTIDIGKIKCLVTVAADLVKLDERENYTLSLNDLQIIGINPTEKSTGLFASKAFEQASHRLGGQEAIAAYVIDGGSDVQNGAKILNEGDKKIKFLYDLSHKLALVLEKELTADPKWEEYTKHLTKSRQLMAQTEFAALMPPKLRSKARFMNAALYIDWPDRIQNSKQAGNLNNIPPDRYEKYFGWLSQYLLALNGWISKVYAVEMIKDVIRIHGLSQNSYNYLEDSFALMPLENEVSNFIRKAMSSLYEEVKKLDADQTLPAFTEVLESTFGSHKNHIGRGGQGLCGNVITLATLVGPVQTTDEIHKAMEETPVRTMLSWVKEKVGETVGSLRRKFFKPKPECKPVLVAFADKILARREGSDDAVGDEGIASEAITKEPNASDETFSTGRKLIEKVNACKPLRVQNIKWTKFDNSSLVGAAA